MSTPTHNYFTRQQVFKPDIATFQLSNEGRDEVFQPQNSLSRSPTDSLSDFNFIAIPEIPQLIISNSSNVDLQITQTKDAVVVSQNVITPKVATPQNLSPEEIPIPPSSTAPNAEIVSDYVTMTPPQNTTRMNPTTSRKWRRLHYSRNLSIPKIFTSRWELCTFLIKL